MDDLGSFTKAVLIRTGTVMILEIMMWGFFSAWGWFGANYIKEQIWPPEQTVEVKQEQQVKKEPQ